MGDTITWCFSTRVLQQIDVKPLMWSSLHLKDCVCLLRVLMVLTLNGSSELASRQMFNRHFFERVWSPCHPLPSELWRGAVESRASSTLFFFFQKEIDHSTDPPTCKFQAVNSDC